MCAQTSKVDKLAHGSFTYYEVMPRESGSRWASPRQNRMQTQDMALMEAAMPKYSNNYTKMTGCQLIVFEQVYDDDTS